MRFLILISSHTSIRHRRKKTVAVNKLAVNNITVNNIRLGIDTYGVTNNESVLQVVVVTKYGAG